MKRVVCVAIFAVLVLAACNGGQAGQETPNPTATPIGSGTATTATPSPVVQAECPTPTVCPAPTACPVCPQPVTCPTCPEPITCPTCPEPVTCATCPEPVICADCPACPQTCPATRTGLTMCIEEKQNAIDLWFSCYQELTACQFALGQCTGQCGAGEGWDLSEQRCVQAVASCPLGVEFDWLRGRCEPTGD